MSKKFGTFEGVFTPSILTILGVIMYMRLGWVVGNAGLWGTIVIILLAHVISVSTGFSLSSIATDKRIRVGGIYYMLSRSLGLPMGGALGITLFAGTAISIALYLIGFAESFNEFFGFGTEINDLRLTGTIALVALVILGLISTSLALKSQYLILAAIGLSLVSVFLGKHEPVGDAAEALAKTPMPEAKSFVEVFAVFFPAVTGFTVGVAMSGDLKSPRKSIPSGTLWAIGVGLVIYLGLAVFMHFAIDTKTLRTDYNALFKMAWVGELVVAGVWGATLSSAIGGVLGAPRILQALSTDKVTPKILGKGYGKNNEPRNALVLAFVIAEMGILIGELNIIARVVTMFYLTAYGFINLAYVLESWASSDFRPTFRIPKWVGAAGFIATFVIMFQLDMVAMIGAFVVIGGIFFLLTRKQLDVQRGDVWQSVWASVVKKGLETMDKKVLHQRNWRPNILLFAGPEGERPFLLDFARWLAGNLGMVTHFELLETQTDQVVLTKRQQSLEQTGGGIFTRKLECKTIYEGVENVSRIYGFSGVEPNTILMGWARNSEDPVQFAKLNKKLHDLDYNVLYLDYDKLRGFGKQQTIDIWWRGAGNNANLTLSLVKFMLLSHEWRNADVRILIVSQTDSDRQEMAKEAKDTVRAFRLKADVRVIENYRFKRPFYDIIKEESADTDLIMLGIPEVREGKEGLFVEKTNELVDIISTTLLVSASSYFEETTMNVDEEVEEEEAPRIIVDDAANEG